jgi:hypothetical protein
LCGIFLWEISERGVNMKKSFFSNLWNKIISIFKKENKESDGEVPELTPIVQQVTGEASRRAVCIGLTAVDPYYYGGWDGDCPGCDVDAKGMYALLTQNGFTAKLMLNAAAKWKEVRKAILDMAAGMIPGDLLVVAMSGHGGQMPDDNGDEEDKIDETICMWDGQVRDDDVFKLISELPQGIRLVLINDQCHSEGNFRAMIRATQQAVSFGAWGKRIVRPLIRRQVGWQGQLIQFAGCREASYSYGGNSGGTWTQSLLRVYHANFTWRQWFDVGLSKMPSNQVPQWVEGFQVQDSFRNGPVLK